MQATEEAEEKYRKMCATNRNAPELKDPHLNLVNVFENLDQFQLDLATPIPNVLLKRLPSPSTPSSGPSVCSSFAHFNAQWRAFTMGALHGLNFDNVFAAGGSVLHCLEAFHDQPTNNTSDVDLFIYGLSEAAANNKIKEIYNAILVNTPQAAIVRGKHAVTIIQEYPTRHIQIVLRLYKSPAEILMGFDIDCCSVGFDGTAVWATPRALRALNQRTNRVDLSRRSLTYEVRLYKYAKRGFAVSLPNPLDRSRISPHLVQKKIGDVRGLARLLIFDSMLWTGTVALDKTTLKTFREDDRRIELQLRSAQEESDYNNILIPWGPRFTISTILDSLSSLQAVASEKSPSSDSIFVSGIEAVINGDTSDRRSVRGPIQWVKENPGTQLLTSSFHPLDASNWEDDAYTPYPNNPNIVFVPIASSAPSSRARGGGGRSGGQATKKRPSFPAKKKSRVSFLGGLNTTPTPTPGLGLGGVGGMGSTETTFLSSFPPDPFSAAPGLGSRFGVPAPAPAPVRVPAPVPGLPPVSTFNLFGPPSSASSLSELAITQEAREKDRQNKIELLRAIRQQQQQQPPINLNTFGTGYSGPSLPSLSSLSATPSLSVPPSQGGLQNIRTQGLDSITTEKEPISPGKLLDKFTAIAPQSDVSKLLLLIATLSRKGLINDQERQQLKDFVIQRKGSLVSALEVFEIEHDFEELADTLKRICKRLSFSLLISLLFVSFRPF